jgi:hypothetical protein
MAYLNGVLCVILALFAIVQYNDPDFLLWFLIYGIAAVWCGLAAFRPAYLAHSRPALIGLGACLVLAAGGSIYLWPTDIATWWDNEVVREGMGLIIVTVSLAIAALTVWRRRHAGIAATA